ncbi:MAG: hypothetical protein JO301_14945 [Chitinophagaceae bacterium]|nr:hypothetical protein [Chitinophagaceae bacterium]
MKKFREEDLILYLYQECPPKLKSAIEQALDEDIALRDRLAVLRRSIRQLDKLRLRSPAKKSIKAIMEHARAASGKK